MGQNFFFLILICDSKKNYVVTNTLPHELEYFATIISQI